MDMDYRDTQQLLSIEGIRLDTEQERFKVEKERLSLERARYAIESERLDIEKKRLPVEAEHLSLEKNRSCREFWAVIISVIAISVSVATWWRPVTIDVQSLPKSLPVHHHVNDTGNNDIDDNDNKGDVGCVK